MKLFTVRYVTKGLGCRIGNLLATPIGVTAEGEPVNASSTAAPAASEGDGLPDSPPRSGGELAEDETAPERLGPSPTMGPSGGDGAPGDLPADDGPATSDETAA